MLITSLWDNKGVAPIYRDYRYVVRLKNNQRTEIFCTSADLLSWLPGDIIHDEKFYIPLDMQVGTYQIAVAIVSPVSFEPKVKLAIEGEDEEGWYPMGEIKITDN